MAYKSFSFTRKKAFKESISFTGKNQLHENKRNVFKKKTKGVLWTKNAPVLLI